MKSPMPTWTVFGALGSRLMAPMARPGSVSPMGVQVGLAAPKLLVFHIPPPEVPMMTSVGSDGFTEMPETRPESTPGYVPPFHWNAASVGPRFVHACPL